MPSFLGRVEVLILGIRLKRIVGNDRKTGSEFKGTVTIEVREAFNFVNARY